MTLFSQKEPPIDLDGLAFHFVDSNLEPDLLCLNELLSKIEEQNSHSKIQLFLESEETLYILDLTCGLLIASWDENPLLYRMKNKIRGCSNLDNDIKIRPAQIFSKKYAFGKLYLKMQNKS